MDEQELARQIAAKEAEAKRERFRWHWHWQNLNRDNDYRIKGSGFWAGRAWLSFGHNSARVEWHLGKHSRSNGMSFDVGGEESFSVSAKIPWLFSLYLALTFPRLMRYLPNDERTTGWWVMDGYIWLEFAYSDGWQGKRGKQIVLHVKDWVTGRSRYSEETISEHEAAIDLPEGRYPVKVRLYKAYWKYPRWWTKTWNRADIDMYTPIPIPASEFMQDMGLDQDHLHSITTTASTLDEAIEAAKASALRHRTRGR